MPELTVHKQKFLYLCHLLNRRLLTDNVVLEQTLSSRSDEIRFKFIVTAYTSGTYATKCRKESNYLEVQIASRYLVCLDRHVNF